MEAEFHTVILLFWGVDGLIFVTTGQRIAVENFEQGLIYKVVFTDNTAKYMMCTGIGKDFVMLFGQDLFALTMATAQRVNTIDQWIEPSPPPSQLLQYQTGVPPFSFKTSGTNLWSYYIQGNDGGIGEKTANIINPDTYYGAYKQPDGTYQTTRDNLYGIKIRPFTSDDIGKMFTFAANISPTSGSPRLSANINGVVINGSFAARSVLTFTVETINDSIFFNYGSGTTTVTTLSQIMLNEGSTALPYEPYGYKFRVICGGQTTNIYIDNPLGADDILYSTQTGIQIPTLVGDNTLSVDTTVQPSEMQIVYEIDLEE